MLFFFVLIILGCGSCLVGRRFEGVVGVCVDAVARDLVLFGRESGCS